MRFALITSAVVLGLLSQPADAQPGASKPAAKSPAKTGAMLEATTHVGAPHSASDPSLIASALSAAPASVAAGATVVGHDGRVLRKGTTDWVCMPDMPDVPNNTPMCLDAPWRGFIEAWMTKKTPVISSLGFGYMLQGDMPVSNVDPFATAPTPSNQWIANGDAHVMVLFPDARLLETLSSDPKSGGPFVMWKGTPYAHVMVPIAAAKK